MPHFAGQFKVMEPTVERQVVGALGSIGAATLASRVLGFVRDMVVALAFGAGPVTDAFSVAFRVPNILRRLLAEGALSTAVIPVFTEYASTRTRDEFRRLLRAILGTGLLALVATTLLGIAAAPWIVRAIAPGFSAEPGQERLAVLLTRVMFPYLILVGLSALAMGTLNAQHRFFAAALGPAVLNVGMIAGVLLLAGHTDPPILALALGVLAGGVGAGGGARGGGAGCSFSCPTCGPRACWSPHRASCGIPPWPGWPGCCCPRCSAWPRCR
jgi:putative peptidoglycan lipid II flippase